MERMFIICYDDSPIVVITGVWIDACSLLDEYADKYDFSRKRLTCSIVLSLNYKAVQAAKSMKSP